MNFISRLLIFGTLGFAAAEMYATEGLLKWAILLTLFAFGLAVALKID